MDNHNSEHMEQKQCTIGEIKMNNHLSDNGFRENVQLSDVLVYKREFHSEQYDTWQCTMNS